MAWAGSVPSRRGRASAVPALPLSLARVLGVALRMFSGACRECSLSWRGLGDHRSVDVALPERLFSFPLVRLGRKGKKKIQVTNGM